MLVADSGRLCDKSGSDKILAMTCPCALASTTSCRCMVKWRYAPRILIRGISTGKQSHSRSGHFIPRKRVCVNESTGIWISSRAGLDTVERSEFVRIAPALLQRR
jgi:hypothetical protein